MNLFLLDAYNLLFRAFCSVPDSIVDRENRSINAVYGMIAFMIRLRRDENATRMVAAFDTPTVPTFRHRLYPLYQAQRGPMGGENADEFLRQVDAAVRIMPRLGVPAVLVPGYEADDIMGTLACRARDAGMEATIVSTDRDVLQLVGPGIGVAVPGSTLTYVRADNQVREKLGVPPSGVTTFKALAGDASDNIPGVRGIGRKTAAALIDAYRDLETMYAHLDEMSPRTRSLMIEGRDSAFLFRELVTLVTDLDLPVEPDNLEPVGFAPTDRVRALLES